MQRGLKSHTTVLCIFLYSALMAFNNWKNEIKHICSINHVIATHVENESFKKNMMNDELILAFVSCNENQQQQQHLLNMLNLNKHIYSYDCFYVYLQLCSFAACKTHYGIQWVSCES